MTTISLTLQSRDSYRWVMLGLCALTASLVVTLPNLSLPPMFASISRDLNLSLVEVGAIWGLGAFPAVFFALIGGTLGDRFGTRRTMVTICLLTGVMGFTRSLAADFTGLLIAVLLFGTVQSVIPVMVFKVIRDRFPAAQLGMASGVISAGFASGLLLGPLLSTSVILPALGGWRQVLVFYAGVAVAFSLLWLVVHPPTPASSGSQTPRIPLGQSLRHVTRLRGLWVLGIGGLGINGCFIGFVGYLPTYLKHIGWADLAADRTLAAFFLSSLIGVIPLSILSDRFRWRRGFLIVAALILASGVAALTFVEGSLIVMVVAATGLVFDAFMAILNASALEVEGVGHVYAGTAIGFTNMVRNIGGTISPPVGNSLAAIALNLPFLFWGAMGLLGVMLFVFWMKPEKVSAPEVETQPLAAG